MKLRAPNEAAVRAFYAAALENGGLEEGPPGQRAAAMTAYFGHSFSTPTETSWRLPPFREMTNVELSSTRADRQRDTQK